MRRVIGKEKDGEGKREDRSGDMRKEKGRFGSGNEKREREVRIGGEKDGKEEREDRGGGRKKIKEEKREDRGRKCMRRRRRGEGDRRTGRGREG